jgi:predicted phosphodiesterase
MSTGLRVAAKPRSACLSVPMPAPVIRIFSDLHYRDGDSRLQNLESLAPLLEGADHVVLNGDTLDTRAPHAALHLAEVRDWFSRHSGAVTFLSGNHDPDISALAELSLAGDRVWITHGDVLFDDVAPWSSLRDAMARSIGEQNRALSTDQRDLIETRLRVNRLACLHLPETRHAAHDDLAKRFLRLAHTLLPPTRLLAMLQAWRTTPARALRLAREQRPRARLIVLGHTHFPGIWRQSDGPVVVNTGSFSRPFPCRFVELCGDEVRVSAIEQKRGMFRRGKTLSAFPLAPDTARAY